MIKLLIVDDEPLVQVGIMSMLNWPDLGIKVIGTAVNGDQALKLIEEHRPELVITDIKMPIMNGLDMIRACREKYTSPPCFIVLTSFEEFPLIKQAVKYQVIDYLIKMELNADMLKESVNKALVRISEMNRSPDPMFGMETDLLFEKFMIRLLNNLFESEEQYLLQARELKLDLSASAYVVCLCAITGIDCESMPQDKLYNLYFSTIQMVRGIARRHMPCHITSLDLKHFCLIFSLDSPEYNEYREKVRKVLSETFQMVSNYFSVNIVATVGRSCTNPYYLYESYQDARQIQALRGAELILFYDDAISDNKKIVNNTFSLSLFKSQIQNAFQSYDADALTETLNSIITLFRNNPTHYLQAMDASCNLLYLSISFLPDGENTLKKVFENYPDGYLSIYKKTNIDQVLNWLEFFRDGLENVLRTQQKDYKNYLIHNVKSFIDSHIEDRLSLNEVASIFSISPNYLSILFKKTTNIGFVEYITQRKISRAKTWILEGKLKIYEIADRLGFESAFYFSKVFKKVEGCSPREFMQKKAHSG